MKIIYVSSENIKMLTWDATWTYIEKIGLLCLFPVLYLCIPYAALLKASFNKRETHLKLGTNMPEHERWANDCYLSFSSHSLGFSHCETSVLQL